MGKIDYKKWTILALIFLLVFFRHEIANIIDRSFNDSVSPSQVSYEAMKKYASMSADAIEVIEKFTRDGKYKGNVDFQAEIFEATKQARLEAFKEVNAMTNEQIGEDRWEAEKAADLLKEIVNGYREASK
jgi:hypothetical protein